MVVGASDLGGSDSTSVTTVSVRQASLHRGAMNRLEAFASSIAAIAPAGSILIVFGAIVAGAGIASPLVLAIAAIAFGLHINTVAEYNRVSPSPGFYVSYVARALGVEAGTVVAAVYGLGELILLGVAIFGPALWYQEVIRLLTGYTPGWWWMLLLEGAIGLVVVLSGVVISVRVIALLFALEVVSILAGVIAILSAHAGSIAASGAGFAPSNIRGGAGGFGIAFVLCILMFSGCSASAPMSDEMVNPRRNIPIAVFSAVGIAGFLFVLAMWAQDVGFGMRLSPMLKSSFPFITAAAAAGGWVKYVLYFSGITSSLAVTIATLNACSRLYFNMGREHLLPSALTVVGRVKKTPWAAIVVVGAGSLLVMLVYTFLAAGPSYAEGYTGYGEIATLGTDLVIVAYIIVNIGLPFFYWKTAKDRFSWPRHVLAPALATLVLLYPLWESIKPSQAAPYNWFWAVVLVVLVLGVVGGWWARRRGLPVGEYVSSEVSVDEAQGPVVAK